jgi:Domain of unknown function (DUF4168)
MPAEVVTMRSSDPAQPHVGRLPARSSDRRKQSASSLFRRERASAIMRLVDACRKGIDRRLARNSTRMRNLNRCALEIEAACPFDMPTLPNQLELQLRPAVPPLLFRSPTSWAACQRAGQHAKETMMRPLMRSPAIAALAAAWLGLVPAASAQAQSPSAQSPAPSAPGPAANITEQKLDAAAAAIQRVASLKHDYQQRIAAAPAAEQERIAVEAINALAKAVTDQGLSVDEYTSILEVAQANPEVREKIRQRLPSASK